MVTPKGLNDSTPEPPGHHTHLLNDPDFLTMHWRIGIASAKNKQNAMSNQHINRSTISQGNDGARTARKPRTLSASEKAW